MQKGTPSQKTLERAPEGVGLLSRVSAVVRGVAIAGFYRPVSAFQNAARLPGHATPAKGQINAPVRNFRSARSINPTEENQSMEIINMKLCPMCRSLTSIPAPPPISPECLRGERKQGSETWRFWRSPVKSPLEPDAKCCCEGMRPIGWI